MKPFLTLLFLITSLAADVWERGVYNSAPQSRSQKGIMPKVCDLNRVIGEMIGEGLMKTTLSEGDVMTTSEFNVFKERIVYASQVGTCLATGMLSTAFDYDLDHSAAASYADIAVRNNLLYFVPPAISYGATALNALGATLAVYSGVEAAKKDGVVSGIITGATDAALMVVGGKLVPVVIAHMADGAKLFTQAGQYLGKYASNLFKGKGGVKFDRTPALDSKLFQKHHVISNKSTRTQDHPLWEMAGMHADEPVNMMLLPTVKGAEVSTTMRSIHQGRHLDSVSKELAKQMQRELEMGELQQWSQSQYRESLLQIIQQERELLKSGTRRLNTHARPWAEGGQS